MQPQGCESIMSNIPAKHHRPMFGKLPPSPTDRWQLVEEFIDVWYGARQSDGFSNAELDAAEKKHGLRLPGELRRWYQRAGRRYDVWCHTLGMYFIEPDALFVSGEHLVFLMDDFEGAISWGIRLQDLDQQDPPIWAMPAQDVLQEGDPPHFPCSATTTGFAISHMLFELGINNKRFIFTPCPSNWLEALPSHFQRCDIEHYYFSNRQACPFYEGIDTIVAPSNGWLCVRTEAAFALLPPSLRAGRSPETK